MTTKYFSFQYSVTYCSQALTETSARLDRSQQVITAGVRKTAAKKTCEHAVDFIWFTDEKVFTVAPPTNLHNGRVYAASGTKKKQSPAEHLLRTRSTFSRSVMVSVAVSTLGRTDLFFVDPGTKVNGQYYRDILLYLQLYYQLLVVCLATSLLFNRTTLLPTEHVRQCIC